MNFETLNRRELMQLLEADDAALVERFPLPLPPRSLGAKNELFAGTLLRRRLMSELLRRMSPADALDSERVRRAVDRHDMLHRVGNLTRYMAASFQATRAALRGWTLKPRRVVIAGLGGSAIGPTMTVEILRNMGYAAAADIRRHYPDAAADLDADTLLVASSYSGNTEESVAWYELAKRRGCPTLCLAKGGRLAELAEANRDPFIRLPVDAFDGVDAPLQPRESIGFSIAAFLVLFERLGLARRGRRRFKTSEARFEEAAQWLERTRRTWAPASPFRTNAAKQLAAHWLYGSADPTRPLREPAQEQTIPVVIVDESNAALGARIENQFGECVTAAIKVLTFFEDAHNEIEQTVTCAVDAKIFMKQDKFSYTAIRSDAETPRAKQRLTRTLREGFANHDILHRIVKAKGETPFQQKLYLLTLLDYARAYASILAGSEPLRVPFMDHLKEAMKRSAWPRGEHY